MNINPTARQRAVFIDIQTDETDQAQSNQALPAPAANRTYVITCIGIVVDDGTQVTEITLENAAEIDLLRQFWQVLQPRDIFIGHNIADRLALLRRLSWKTGLIPSSEVHLRNIYGHSMAEHCGRPIVKRW